MKLIGSALALEPPFGDLTEVDPAIRQIASDRRVDPPSPMSDSIFC